MMFVLHMYILVAMHVLLSPSSSTGERVAWPDFDTLLLDSPRERVAVVPRQEGCRARLINGRGRVSVVHVCTSRMAARLWFSDWSVSSKLPPCFSRSTRWVGLLFDVSIIAMLWLTGRFHFLTNGFHLLADVLDTLVEGPTEELLTDDRREKDVEEGISPPLTTITNRLKRKLCDLR